MVGEELMIVNPVRLPPGIDLDTAEGRKKYVEWRESIKPPTEITTLPEHLRHAPLDVIKASYKVGGKDWEVTWDPEEKVWKTRSEVIHEAWDERKRYWIETGTKKGEGRKYYKKGVGPVYVMKSGEEYTVHPTSPRYKVTEYIRRAPRYNPMVIEVPKRCPRRNPIEEALINPRKYEIELAGPRECLDIAKPTLPQTIAGMAGASAALVIPQLVRGWNTGWKGVLASGLITAGTWYLSCQLGDPERAKAATLGGAVITALKILKQLTSGMPGGGYGISEAFGDSEPSLLGQGLADIDLGLGQDLPELYEEDLDLLGEDPFMAGSLGTEDDIELLEDDDLGQPGRFLPGAGRGYESIFYPGARYWYLYGLEDDDLEDDDLGQFWYYVRHPGWWRRNYPELFPPGMEDISEDEDEFEDEDEDELLEDLGEDEDEFEEEDLDLLEDLGEDEDEFEEEEDLDLLEDLGEDEDEFEEEEDLDLLEDLGEDEDEFEEEEDLDLLEDLGQEEPFVADVEDIEDVGDVTQINESADMISGLEGIEQDIDFDEPEEVKVIGQDELDLDEEDLLEDVGQDELDLDMDLLEGDIGQDELDIDEEDLLEDVGQDELDLDMDLLEGDIGQDELDIDEEDLLEDVGQDELDLDMDLLEGDIGQDELDIDEEDLLEDIGDVENIKKESKEEEKVKIAGKEDKKHKEDEVMMV